MERCFALQMEAGCDGLIVAGSLADPGGNWKHTLWLAVGLTAFGALVFVYGLGVQVPLWPV